MENAQKILPVLGQQGGTPIVDFEKHVFGTMFTNPIDALGDLAPAKRMWRAFKSALDVVNQPTPNFQDCFEQILDARNAYLDWKDRTHLPSGLRPDPASDLTFVMPGVHRVWIQFDDEPSRRLRFYQFDPAHHDVAIYSMH